MNRPAWSRVALCALLGGVVSCRTSDPSDPPGGGDPAGSASADPSGDAQIQHHRGAAEVQFRRPGAGHNATISLVALSANGKAAVSRDHVGEVRLWPSLDGEDEPVVIPDRGAQSLSCARRGEGHVVATVDAAAGGKIFVIDGDRGVTLAGSTPPFEPLFELHALPGGEHVLALYKDHSLKLLDRTGKTVATWGKRRFNPTRLVVAEDGRSVAAVANGKKARSVDVQRLRIGTAKGETPTLRPDGDAVTFTSTQRTLDRTAFALSPDLQRGAWVDRTTGGEWEMGVRELSDDGPGERFQIALPTHQPPFIGFSSRDRILVTSVGNQLAFEYDTVVRQAFARVASPQGLREQQATRTLRGGVQLVAFGVWLFVQDLARKEQRYLGYESRGTRSVALSPSGELVAWMYETGDIFVEPLRAPNASGVQLHMPVAPLRVRFMTEERLLTVDANGGLTMLDWRTGEPVAESGIDGNVRSVALDRKLGLLLVTRHSNDARVVEVSDDGFGDVHVVADQAFRSGLLGGEMPGRKGAVLWTLDSASRSRFYSLKALRSDRSLKETEAMAVPLATGEVAPLAIDRRGTKYTVQWTGSQMELVATRGKDKKSVASPSGDITQIIPAPSGERFALLHQRGPASSLTVHDAASLEELWSYATGVPQMEVEWSQDGAKLVVTATNGAAVIDAATGETVRRRCSLGFVAKRSLPSNAFGGQSVASLCGM